MHESFLGIPVDLADAQAALAAAEHAVAASEPLLVVAINPEKVMRARRDPELREFILSAGLRIADGVGLLLASRLRGGRLRARVTGIDLMLTLAGAAAQHGWRVYLLGARPDVVEAAALALRERFPNIALCGFHDGYFPKEEAAERAAEIRRQGADVLFVALGSPAQERFLRGFGEATGAKLLMGVGGSFDVLAGKVPRAPGAMRAVGLEWLYRLWREPSRIGRMAVLPVFLWQALRERR